uniref:helix-turn-helix domain-containing protein n=1 Tax=Actinomyces qiguomingii TaxID=2057800 RepID=UPI003A0FFC7E
MFLSKGASERCCRPGPWPRLLDALIPALRGRGERDDLTVVMKGYSAGACVVRRWACTRRHRGRCVRGIAQDLGVCRGTLREWLHRWGTGRKTGPDGAPAPSPLKPKTDLGDRTGTQTPAQAGAESMEERVARLEAA